MHEKKNPNKPLIVYYIIALVVVMLLNALLFPQIERYSVKQVDYSEFLSMLDEGKIKSVQIEDTQIAFTPVEQIQDGKATYYTTNRVTADDKLVDRLLAAGVEFGQVVPEEMSPIISFFVSWVLPLVIFYALGSFMFRKMSQRMGGNTMSFGKSNAKIYVEAQTGKTFDDVAGEDEAKDALKEIVDFLHDPQKYRDIGAKLPKGALLVGPPGTGKTLLAKAVAGEAGVPFMSISGSDFVEMFVGVGASRVRDLFDQAKKHAPCIVFIDEIDAVGRRRGAGMGGGHDEREQTLNQLLVEMDGFAVNEGVIVLAATNRKDILDPALLRPGRFDRQITVGYPDVRGREAILRVHAKEKPLADDVDLANIAKRTPYFAGADLENIMNEAAILCAREGKDKITMRHLNDAIERVQMGPEKKSHIVSDEDKRLVACHEAGHAIVGELLDGCDDVHLVTIMPRGGSGGHTLLLPDKESDFTTRAQLLDFVAMALGGYAAETLVMGQMSTGASSDLQRATDICRRMVTQYGMSDDMGPIYLGGDHDEVFLARDYGQQSRTYSEDVAARIDAEVQRKMNDALARATAVLKAHRAQLDGLSDLLVEKETIDRAEFVAFLKGEPCPEKKEENVLREPEQV